MGKQSISARVAPESRARLRAAARRAGITVESLVEQELTALIDGIDVESLRSGKSTPPGMAGSAPADSVPFNPRIDTSLRRRLQALTALVDGVTLQGLVTEAIAQVPDIDDTDELWELVAGESNSAGQHHPTPRRTSSTTATTPPSKSTTKRPPAAARKSSGKRAAGTTPAPTRRRTSTTTTPPSTTSSAPDKATQPASSRTKRAPKRTPPPRATKTTGAAASRQGSTKDRSNRRGS
jgi:predicted HicB family RNase H-like nuclease